MPRSDVPLSTDEQSMWVKVSDRLPERGSETCEWSTSLLATIEYSYPSDIDKEPDRIVEYAQYHTRLKVWFQGEHVLEQYDHDGRVIAWRPMPEPYRE